MKVVASTEARTEVLENNSGFGVFFYMDDGIFA